MSDLTLTIMLAVFGGLLPALFIDWLMRRKKKYRNAQLMIRPLRFGKPFRFVFPGEPGYCDFARMHPGPQLFRTIVVVAGAVLFITYNPPGTTDLTLLMATIGLAILLGPAAQLAIVIYRRR